MKTIVSFCMLLLCGFCHSVFATPAQTNVGSFVHQITLQRDSVKTQVSQWVSPVQIHLPFARGFLNIQSAVMYAEQKTLTSQNAWGALDTRLDAQWQLGNRALLNLNTSLPTGKRALDANDANLVRLLSRNDLNFPIKTFGQGLNAGGALSLVHHSGHWSWSMGGGYDYKGKYDPVDGVVNYKPGDEVSASFGFDYTYNHFVYRFTTAGTFFFTDRQDGLVVFRNGKQLLVQAGILYTGQRFRVKTEVTDIIRLKNKDLSNSQFLYETRDSNGNDFRAHIETSWTPISWLTVFGTGYFKYLTANAYAPNTPLYQGDAHLLEGGGGFSFSLSKAYHITLRGTRLTGKTEDNSLKLSAFNLHGTVSIVF